MLRVLDSSRGAGRGGGDARSGRGRAKRTEDERERRDAARSPHYFVQITHAAVICEIPVILHFKLENKMAWLAAAYPADGISILSPPVTLALLLQANRARLL